MVWEEILQWKKKRSPCLLFFLNFFMYTEKGRKIFHPYWLARDASPTFYPEQLVHSFTSKLILLT